MRRIDFDEYHQNEQQEHAAPAGPHVYYNDGTLLITSQVVQFGNKKFAIPAIHGVEWEKNKNFNVVTLLWTFLSLFGLLFGPILFTLKSYATSFIITGGSAAILYKMYVGKPRCSVLLKLGGLNNEVLSIKNEESAKHICDSIFQAISDHHTPPPEGGQPATFQPIFPSPVLLRN
jgi:hypothetical protein